MTDARLRAALPYVIGLFAAAGLFLLAGSIQYSPRRGQIGPDFWPKLAIGLMAAVCLVEIARAFLTPNAEAARGLAEVLDTEGEEEGESHPRLLVGGVLLTSAYAVLVPWLGFLLASFLFLASFMYLGRYRRHAIVWAISVGATFLIGFLFLRFAYVSLPRGEPPFDRFTDLIRSLVGA